MEEQIINIIIGLLIAISLFYNFGYSELIKKYKSDVIEGIMLKLTFLFMFGILSLISFLLVFDVLGTLLFSFFIFTLLYIIQGWIIRYIKINKINDFRKNYIRFFLFLVGIAFIIIAKMWIVGGIIILVATIWGIILVYKTYKQTE